MSSLKTYLKFRPTIKTIESVVWMLAIMLLWETFVRAFKVPYYLLPPPSKIIQELFSRKEIWRQLFVTSYEVLMGFFLATAIGIVLAILIAHSSHLERGFYPLLSLLESVPKIAFAPILIVWFGLGYLPRIIIAFLIVFFPIVVNTITGLTLIEAELLNLMHSLRATKWQVLTKIRLPSSLPYIFNSLKISAPISVIGAVTAELMSGNTGLGYLVIKANALVDMSLLFASVFCMAVLGLAMFGAVAIVEKRLMPWYQK